MTIQKSIILSFEFTDITCLNSPLSPPPPKICVSICQVLRPPPPSTADIIYERSLRKMQALLQKKDENIEMICYHIIEKYISLTFSI